ncbi:DedA family protein [Actinoplanes sp. NEAU-A12]|uniref:DedA family protein n=1 Tax=Actinoplanes sandaracinus TaxID=3045177 RepID=A0ABT6WJU4_9ACTN|nr:DedA family protein [Actinoplanes sandaracinus]MDI6100000.1 DedA family protein [Actinoplanes sandaracinus]
MPLQLDATSPWAFVVIAASIAGSAVFPPLPSEGMLATAMSLAAAGRLPLAWVCVSTTAGAVLGDLAAYTLGRALSRPGHARAAGSARLRTALAWLHAREHTWGPGMIVTGRFVPGGTTAVGISAGLLRFPPRRYLLFSSIGAALWTGYGVAVGIVGNAVFPDNPLAGAAAAVGLALAIGAGVQWLSRTRHRE